MERELTRHLKDCPSKATAELIKKYRAYPVNLSSLPPLPTRDELEAECIDRMIQQWREFTEHFVVERLPIVGDLEEVVDWYFKVEPPFGKGKKSKEFPDAFILSALDQYHGIHSANIAAISGDNDFETACMHRRYVAYFPNLKDYIDRFIPQLKGEDLERPELIRPNRLQLKIRRR